MRSIAILTAGAALTAAVAADAQAGQGAPYPMPGGGGPVVHRPPMPQAPRAPVMGSQRWGSHVGGRWWGGVNAPGGWQAYRQPYRGYRLPVYWVAPRFYVTDWSRYGLTAPAGGHRWVRYYDDAVLVDDRGAAHDWRGGVDWDGAGNAYADRDGGGVDDRSRNGGGVGGAVAGAVVGGVAGNVIAGRGNRLGGTLIGAGVGAAAGYAIDRAGDGRHGRRGAIDRPDYRHDEPPMAPDGPPPHYRDDERRERREVIIRREGDRGYPRGDDRRGGYPGDGAWTSADGRTTVTTTQAGSRSVIVVPGGYGAGSGGGYGSAVTTVTIQSEPVVTTVTEVVEDVVTYSRPTLRRAAPKRVWHARPKTKTRPRCGC